MPVPMATRSIEIARGFVGESLRQPVYWIVTGLFSAFAVPVWFVFDRFSLSRSRDLILETALGSLTLMGLVLLLLTGTGIFHEEIRNRTAVTLLSKPVSLLELVLGKILGIAFVLLPAYGAMSLVYALLLTRGGADLPVGTLLPGLLLAYAQVLLLASVGLLLSVHLPQAAVAGGLLGLYSLGNLLGHLRAEATSPWLSGVLSASRLFIPDLTCYDLTRAAALGVSIPTSYLCLSLLHAALYGGAALLASTWLLERRELY